MVGTLLTRRHLAVLATARDLGSALVSAPTARVLASRGLVTTSDAPRPGLGLAVTLTEAGRDALDGDEAQIAEAAADYVRGAALAELAAGCGLTVATLRRRLLTAGAEMRRRGRAGPRKAANTQS